MQTNRICKTCGKKYFFCSNCDKNLNDPQWKLMWHEENCKNIFEIVSSYVQKQIPKEVAKEKLEKCNLREVYTFKENIRLIIEEIIREDKKVFQMSNNENEEKPKVEEQSKKKQISKRPSHRQGKRN